FGLPIAESGEAFFPFRYPLSGFRYRNVWLSRARSSRAPALRAPSRARELTRGRLALRGHQRNLHSANRDDGTAGARWDRLQAHPLDHADTGRDAARRSVAPALSATCRPPRRIVGA